MMNDNACFNCQADMTDCECGDTEGYSSNGAVCPYCGHTDLACDSGGRLYDESNTTNKCPSCGEEYVMDLYIVYTWTTKKPNESQA